MVYANFKLSTSFILVLGISTDMKRQSQSNQKNVDPVKRHRIEQDDASTSGNRNRSSINPIRGNIFHLKLTMLFLIRGINAGYRSFNLGNELEEEGGKFDDLIFKNKRNGEEKLRYRYLQAKHKMDGKGKLNSKNSHVRDDGGNFSLPKYFRSYCANLNGYMFCRFI